jgi:hypothetical protein
MAEIGVYVVVGFFIAVFAASAWHVAKTNRERERLWNDLDAEGVKRGLDLLLKRGYQGAFAIVEHQKTGRFVQFLKYVDDAGEVGLEMHFPRADWSAAFYPKILTLLRSRGIEFERQAVDRQVVPDPQTAEFICVDFAANTTLAADVASQIATDIFELGQRGFSMRADGICLLDRDTDIITYPMPKDFPFATGRKNH